MLNENIVSLLIPCYNGEQFVERCLINVLEQEYAQYIELILVTDALSVIRNIKYSVLWTSYLRSLITGKTSIS